jgi:hypothetical protein
LERVVLAEAAPKTVAIWVKQRVMADLLLVVEGPLHLMARAPTDILVAQVLAVEE